jgi:uncharacterized protein YegL
MMTASDTEAIRDTAAVDGQVIMPFYLLVDVSSSMSSEEVELNAAIAELVENIRKDPVVDDLVMLSVITFNHDAQTVVPLSSPSELTVPHVRTSGGTSYGAAFAEYARAFEQDRDRLRQQGMKVYRPCVFFLTDGAPGDGNYLQTFRSLFAYDPASKTGNKAFPYFIPFGFRSAPEDVIKRLAYPDFGATKGRWFLSRSSNVREILRAMAAMLGNTVISSGQSASQGVPQIVPPTSTDPSTQFGEAGDFV